MFPNIAIIIIITTVITIFSSSFGFGLLVLGPFLALFFPSPFIHVTLLFSWKKNSRFEETIFFLWFSAFAPCVVYYWYFISVHQPYHVGHI